MSASANPMSGELKDAGEMKVKAIQLAFDEVNRKGGINGRKVKLVIADDSAKMLMEGIGKNGANRKGIYEYMNEIKDYPGVTGNITFDDHHDVEEVIKIVIVKNGKFALDTNQP